MTQVAGTTLPRKIPGGLPRCGVLSFPGIEQILYVSQDSSYVGPADGTIQKPFTTIGAAVAAAGALTPAEDNRILILIYPGIYDEQVTLADDYVMLCGVDRDACILYHDTAAPLVVTADVVSVWDLKIESDAGQDIVDVTGSADFYECLFQGDDTAGEQVVVTTTGTVRFKDCFFAVTDDGNIVLNVGAAAATVLLEGCDVVGVSVLADGAATFHDCWLFSTGATATIECQAGLDSLRVQGCEVWTDSSGDVISLAAQVDLTLLGNTLQTTAGTYSVQAGAAVTGAVIEDNVMIGGGIHANVSHVKPERIVGASGMCDWYATTQEALTSCTFDDITVKLRRDEVAGALIVPPALRVIVDGCGKHTLTRAAGADVIAATTSRNLILRDLILDGRILHQNPAAYLTILSCECLAGILLANAAGGDMRITDSYVIAGVGTMGAIDIRGDATPIILKRSRLKGTAGKHAVYWDNGITNNNLKIQDCTIMHGSLGANNPFGRNAAQTPNYRSTHSIYNLDPQTGAIWTNLVAAAQRFDSYDVNGDY